MLTTNASLVEDHDITKGSPSLQAYGTLNGVIERSIIGLSPIDTARSDQTSELAIYAPATHGMLRIACEIDGNKIVSATPLLGSMHRGAEKLFESRDY